MRRQTPHMDYRQIGQWLGIIGAVIGLLSLILTIYCFIVGSILEACITLFFVGLAVVLTFAGRRLYVHGKLWLNAYKRYPS